MKPDHTERTALFAGSFNPFTIGHLDIVERGLAIFDRVVVAVGVNAQKTDDAATVGARVAAIRAMFEGDDRVQVVSYSGLTVDLARAMGCTALLRGVRSAADYDYERNLADVNRNLSGIESVLLLCRPELAWVSSSVVRELQSYGKDTSALVPAQPPKSN